MKLILLPLSNTLQKATHAEDINLFTLIEEEVSVSIFFHEGEICHNI